MIYKTLEAGNRKVIITRRVNFKGNYSYYLTVLNKRNGLWSIDDRYRQTEDINSGQAAISQANDLLTEDL